MLMTREDTQNTDSKTRKEKEAEAREARLKAALRANLHRRKGQARARKDGPQDGAK